MKPVVAKASNIGEATDDGAKVSSIATEVKEQGEEDLGLGSGGPPKTEKTVTSKTGDTTNLPIGHSSTSNKLLYLPLHLLSVIF